MAGDLNTHRAFQNGREKRAVIRERKREGEGEKERERGDAEEGGG